MLPINGAETEIKQSQLSTMAVEMSYNSSNPQYTVIYRVMKSPSSHPNLHIPSTVKTENELINTAIWELENRVV